MNVYIFDNSPEWLRNPKEKKYDYINFETVGKCPRCNNTVTSSIYHTDKRCSKCQLKLYWD